MSGKFEWPSGFNAEINRLAREQKQSESTLPKPAHIDTTAPVVTYAPTPSPIDTTGQENDAVRDAIEELKELAMDEDYRPDSFTLQPLRSALKSAPASIATTQGDGVDPCPFCGHGAEETHANDFSYHYVGCPNEDCWVQPETGHFTIEKLAREAWNWKPKPAPQAEAQESFTGWYAETFPVYAECFALKVTRYGVDPVEAKEHMEAALKAWNAQQAKIDALEQQVQPVEKLVEAMPKVVVDDVELEIYRQQFSSYGRITSLFHELQQWRKWSEIYRQRAESHLHKSEGK